jgi:hypothetical protein
MGVTTPRSYATDWWEMPGLQGIIRSNKSAIGPAWNRTNRLTRNLLYPGVRLMPQYPISPESVSIPITVVRS